MKQIDATVWVLLGARAGDNAQALELARRVGGQVVEKTLQFNRIAGIPSWVTGAGFATLENESRQILKAPWPDLVIATGRKTARISLAIKTVSRGQTKVVQIGRPRLPLTSFDLVLTTAQYNLPPGPNTLELPMPFAAAKSVDAASLKLFQETWKHLPKPWIVGVIGAAKFPVRFGGAELLHFSRCLNQLAQSSGGGVILLDSPRSTQGALQSLAAQVTSPKWVWQRGVGQNPYQAALALGDQFAVTSDSVSMVSEMVGTGKSTHVFHLPVSRLVPRWSAKVGFSAMLARTGILSPPRDVAEFISGLEKAGWIGNLNEGRGPTERADFAVALGGAVVRVRALLSR